MSDDIIERLGDFWPDNPADRKLIADSMREVVERLRADAIRYRWLKSRNKVSLLSDGSQWSRPDGSTFAASHSLSADGTRWGVYETLDETIDRAMEGGR